MFETETQRAQYLQKLFKKSGAQLEDWLEEGFHAAILHSFSTLITANEPLLDLIGYSAEDITGMNAWLLFPPESISIVQQKLAELSEEPYTVAVKRKDRTIVMVELKGKNVLIADEPMRIILARKLSA